MSIEPSSYSKQFLSDLEIVCPRHVFAVTPAFLDDLDVVSQSLGVFRTPAEILQSDLELLARRLDSWRRIHATRLVELIERLPGDDPLLCPISLFGTMDFGRLETAHTRTLAWLLRGAEHGFGHLLLEALLRRVSGIESFRLTLEPRVQSEVSVSGKRDQGDGGRIDVVAEGEWEKDGKTSRWILAIEAKVDAEEGEDQLSRYDAWLEWRLSKAPTTEILRVFLTPHGAAPSTGAATWQSLSFAEIAGVFRQVPRLHEKSGYHFLRYYLSGVLKDICGLPTPFRADCRDPYSANEYLSSLQET